MSQEETKKMTVAELMAFVRKQQIYKGNELLVDPTPYDSISKWLGEDQIDKGPHAVRGSMLYKRYESYCQSHNIPKAEIATRQKFHATMIDSFGSSKSKTRNTFYYVNKRIVYEPQKKKDQAASRKKIQKKEKVVGTRAEDV